MTCDEIDQIFKSITAVSNYKRVSADHPYELFLGLNESGRKTLRFNGDFEIKKGVKGGGILEIKQLKFKQYGSLLFIFNSDYNESLFCRFCEDIINQTEKYVGNNVYDYILNRYSLWKKMFSGRSDVLSDKQVAGLIGELTYLNKEMIPRYGSSVAVNGWSGPDPAHKDFSVGDDWFEIKTVVNSSEVVTISSVEQLDSETPGKLVVYLLEKMSPEFNGITLNNLAYEILNNIEGQTDKNTFADKLAQAGFCFDDAYDNIVYRITQTDTYSVSDGFPRLTRAGLAEGIVNAKYEISLTAISRFKEN